MSTPTRRKPPAGAAKKAVPVVNAADTSETEEFPLGTWWNPEAEKIEPRMVLIRKPDETDSFVLLRINRILDQGQKRGDQEMIMDAVGAFGDVIDSLFVDREDRLYALDALVSRTITPGEYGQLLYDVMKRWGITEDESAPTTGPRPTKRAAGARRR